MALEESTDHTTRALARLPEQFKGQANIEAFISSYIETLQTLETASFELLTETTLDTAVGDNLDLLGRIVGEDRAGRTDTVYRLAIRARIKLNLSSGTVPEILEILALVLGSAYTFALTQYPPAAFVVDVNEALDAESAAETADILSQARAAGVRADFHWSEDDEAETFAFSDDDTDATDAARGFADTNLLSYNQAGAEEATTDGFLSVDSASIATSAGAGWEGSRRINVGMVTVNGVRGGVRLDPIPVQAATGYVGSVHVRRAGGAVGPVRAYLRDEVNGVDGPIQTLVPNSLGWQRFTDLTLTTGAGSPTISLYVLEDVADSGLLFAIDGLQIERGSVSTTWVEGGTSLELGGKFVDAEEL